MGTFHMEDLYPAFRETKVAQSVLALAVSQVPLIQTNQYAKVAYFGVLPFRVFCSCKKERGLSLYIAME